VLPRTVRLEWLAAKSEYGEGVNLVVGARSYEMTDLSQPLSSRQRTGSPFSSAVT